MFGALNGTYGQQPVVRNLTVINTGQSEYSPIFYGDELVYVHQPANGRFDPRSKQTYFELFRAPVVGEKKKKGRRFKVELNTSYHEGPITFSADRQQVFFTKTNARDGVTVSSQSGEAKLKIYYAFQGQYDWTGVQELSINDDEHNTLHPSLSADGNRLFFTSDRPGGHGGLDLYFSEWRNGAWTPPINLGSEVNSSGNDCYPYIHESGRLFFASDRSGGMGRLDLYTIDLSGRQWGKVYRLPEPYNSPSDDFGMILGADEQSGYLSSNRPGGKGEDDIYSFTSPNGIQDFIGNTERLEMVSVYAGETSQQLAEANIFLSEIAAAGPAGAEVQLLRSGDGTFVLTTGHPAPLNVGGRPFKTASDGGVELPLREGKHYRMLVHKAGYLPAVLRFGYGSEGPSRPLEVVLRSGNCLTAAGSIRAETDNDPVPGAEVIFYPVNGNVDPIRAKTESDGSYYVCLPADQDYQVVVRHEQFRETRSAFNASSKMGSYHLFNLVLADQPGVSQVRPEGLPANSVIVLNDLQYVDDRFELQRSANSELMLLEKLLQENPGIRVRLENHTETGGPEVYHLEMSEKRVEGIREFLVEAGVRPDRIQIVAHGSRVPRRDCSRPVNCDPEEHRTNRRTEVRVLSTTR